MNDTGIVLCIVAIAAIAADVIVRLVIAPRRMEKFMEELMDCIGAGSGNWGDDGSSPGHSIAGGSSWVSKTKEDEVV